MSDVNDDDLKDGIVRIVPEGEEVPFRDRFEGHLMNVRTSAEQGWERGCYREPKFMDQGIAALHRQFGRCGRRKVRSAAIQYGFRAHKRRRHGNLVQLGGLIDDIRASSELYADKLSMSRSLTYARRGEGKNSVKFYIESDRNGLMGDIAEVYGYNYSQLCRHYVAVALYDADLGRMSEAAFDYVEGLWEATELQEPTIRQTIDYLEENDDG